MLCFCLCDEIKRLYIKMYRQLGFLCFWPSREIIISNMPSSFKAAFASSLAIIDTAPRLGPRSHHSLLLNSQCYSDYKSTTTLKGLIAVDPRGQPMYISPLFSGSISDNEICRQSGFFEFLSKLKCRKVDRYDQYHQYLAEVKAEATVSTTQITNHHNVEGTHCHGP